MKSWVKPIVAVLCGGVVWVVFSDGVAADRKFVAAAMMVGYALVLLRFHKKTALKQCRDTARESDYLVAYATETGTARQFAKQTCKLIQKEGMRASLIELNELASAQVPARALLVVASTTGNGEAPRTAGAWQEVSRALQGFASCSYAVLALGDRSYPRFCCFGIEVASDLRQIGAIPLFEPVLVHQGDPASVKYWFSQLAQSVVPTKH
ncbi:flavodoxin family protein [Marinobacter sp. S6332]|uniref:flavodoxin domain-containing protein n=1 Tax=Marinobacter sp. S6332 TaxID=2926403 RepID=UPI001FF11F52|nr:flavodoxin family protein [Marinobacter sp. S6332]